MMKFVTSLSVVSGVFQLFSSLCNASGPACNVDFTGKWQMSCTLAQTSQIWTGTFTVTQNECFNIQSDSSGLYFPDADYRFDNDVNSMEMTRSEDMKGRDPGGNIPDSHYYKVQSNYWIGNGSVAELKFENMTSYYDDKGVETVMGHLHIVTRYWLSGGLLNYSSEQYDENYLGADGKPVYSNVSCSGKKI